MIPIEAVRIVTNRFGDEVIDVGMQRCGGIYEVEC